MQGDAISSGFACISRRFSAGLVGSSARKSVQWTDFSENGSADPRRTGRQAPEPSQGKSTQKCRQRRRNCASGILETHSSRGVSGIAKGSTKGTVNREQGTGMAADAIRNNANSPGVSGAERPDFQSFSATCAAKTGRFLRQGACRPEQ